MLDGTSVQVKGYPEGNFLGPTILTNVTPQTPAYQVELFAPALCVVKVATFDEAIQLINLNPFVSTPI